MDLAVIGFIIAIVGIALQLADAFPEHRETRNIIVLLSIGIFLGILASVLLGAKYNITGNIDRQFVLLYGLVGLAGILTIIGIMVGDAKRREAALASAAIAAVLFVMTGIAIGLGSAREVYNYSTDEVLILANDAEQNGQYETAIERLEELRGRLNTMAAREAVTKRIDSLHAAQIGKPSKKGTQ